MEDRISQLRTKTILMADVFYTEGICLACRGPIINSLCSHRYLSPHTEKFMELVVEELSKLVPKTQLNRPSPELHIKAIQKARLLYKEE